MKPSWSLVTRSWREGARDVSSTVTDMFQSLSAVPDNCSLMGTSDQFRHNSWYLALYILASPEVFLVHKAVIGDALFRHKLQNKLIICAAILFQAS